MIADVSYSEMHEASVDVDDGDDDGENDVDYEYYDDDDDYGEHDDDGSSCLRLLCFLLLTPIRFVLAIAQSRTFFAQLLVLGFPTTPA